MSLLIDGMRFMLWVFAKVFLIVSDWLYEALEMIVKLDLSSSKAMRYTWLFFLGFLSFMCIFRIVIIVFKRMSDPEENVDIMDFPKKILYVFVAVALSTTTFYFALGLPSQIYKIYSETIRYDDRLIPSTAVLSSTALTPLSNELDNMIATEETVDIDTIDNDLNKENNEGDYIYFVGTSELLLCIAGSFVVMFLQLNVVVDTGTRLFLNIFRFVVGFIPISSIIDKDSTFGDWCRDIASDTFMIAFNIIAMQLVFGVMTFNSILKLNGIVRIVIFAVGLIAIGKIGNIIAKYFRATELSGGGNIGSMLLGMTAFQTMRAGGRAMGNIARGAGSGLVSAGGYVGNKIQTGYSSAKDYMNNKKNNHNFGGGGSDGTSGMQVDGSNGISIDKASGLRYNTRTGEVISSNHNPSFSSELHGSSVYTGGDSMLDINPMQATSQSTYMSGATEMRLAFAGTRLGTRALENTMGMSRQESYVHQAQNQGKNSADLSKEKVKSDKYSGSRYLSDTRKQVTQKTGTSFVEGKTRGHMYRGSERRFNPKARERYDKRNVSTKQENQVNREINRARDWGKDKK